MNRYAARELVTFDRALSSAASAVYQALDEYARESGVCWPKQITLAERLGYSIRHIQRCLAELVSHGLCSVERKTPGGPNRYRLIHAAQTVRNHATSVSPPRDIGVATHATSASPLIRNNTDIEPERAANAERQTPVNLGSACQSCRGTGKVLIAAIGWSACTPCRGSGKARRSA